MSERGGNLADAPLSLSLNFKPGRMLQLVTSCFLNFCEGDTGPNFVDAVAKQSVDGGLKVSVLTKALQVSTAARAGTEHPLRGSVLCQTWKTQ